MIHPIDYRYGSPEMRAIWSEEARMHRMLDAEVALAEALAELGKIPKKDAATIREAAKAVEAERVREIEKETKHDVMALVRALTEQAGDSGKYVHLTATSYDIVDTALALQLRDGLDILMQRGDELLRSCLKVAEKHKKQVMIGRTHGQHAIPITLGFKFANYADKLGSGLERLAQDRIYVAGKFSGAVGTYAAQQSYGMGDGLERAVMKRLGISAADISTQVVPRENMARIISDIVILAGTVEQIAKEVRNLQRTEIAELSEPFGEKQVGSSTMAQKRNPIDSENICSNVRIIRSCIMPALEDIALEHERDLTNSAAERSLLPTAFVLADDVLTRARKITDGLVVFPQNMACNLKMTRGTIMAEAVITELVKRGMGRQEAHELLRTASMQAFEKGRDLKDVLLANKELTRHIGKAELEKLMDPNAYIGLSVEKTDQILRKWAKR